MTKLNVNTLLVHRGEREADVLLHSLSLLIIEDAMGHSWVTYIVPPTFENKATKHRQVPMAGRFNI